MKDKIEEIFKKFREDLTFEFHLEEEIKLLIKKEVLKGKIEENQSILDQYDLIYDTDLTSLLKDKIKKYKKQSKELENETN